MSSNFYPPGAVRPPPHNPPQWSGGTVAFPYESEKIPEDDIHVVDMLDIPVPKAMGDVHKHWCSHQGVVIAAPTGAGKTTYIGRLIKDFASRKEKTLVLGPRNMLRSEHKKRLPALAGSKWGKVVESATTSSEDDEDSKREVVDLALSLTREFRDVHLEIMTFQELARQYKIMDLKKYKLVVIDEAHRAYTDALFDTSADFVFEKIPEWFSGACRVYLTATPGAILEDLVRVEKASFAYCPGTRTCARIGCGQIRMYRFPNHFDGLSLHYYRESDEMVAHIKAHPSEKYIIFVTRCEDTDDAAAHSYYAKLKAAGIDVAYLDSNEKGSSTWDNLRNNNKFSSQVLVTTKVDSLHHVVLETFDKTEFIQELGRKRRDPGEHVHVYVKAHSQKALKTRLNQVEDWISICERGVRSQTYPDHNLLLAGWNDENPAHPYSKLLIPTSADAFKVRLTAYHALLRQQGTLNRLIRMGEEYNDDSALPRLVHEWLEDPDGYSEKNWLGYDNLQEKRLELIQFLEANRNRDLCSLEYDDFRKSLQKHLAELVVKSHDSNRDLKERALNDRLKELELPFFIKKEEPGFFRVYIKK